MPKSLCDSLSLITFTFTLQGLGGSLRSSPLIPARLQVLLQLAAMTGLPKGSSAFARRGLMNSKPGWLPHYLHIVSECGWKLELIQLYIDLPISSDMQHLSAFSNSYCGSPLIRKQWCNVEIRIGLSTAAAGFHGCPKRFSIQL